MAAVGDKIISRVAAVTLPHRPVTFLSAAFLTAGLALLQAFIGGRRLLFLFPGLFLIAIAALIGVAAVGRSKTRADPWCLYATAIFVGYILIRGLASADYFARPDLFSVAGALLVYALTVTLITSSTARSAIIAALLTFALVHVFVGFIQFSRGDNFMLIPFLQRADYGQRASGFYVCPNHLAGLLEVLGIFAVSFICWSRWPVWGKFLAAYATAVCYVGLALTGSRGGYLSAIASFVTFGVLSLFVLRSAHRRSWWRYAAAGLGGLMLLLVAGSLVIRHSGFLSERAANIIDTKNMRVELWHAAVQQWHLQPLVGTGSGTYRFYGRQFRLKQMQNDPIDVHNDYLHLLCEYGLIGAAGFLIFFGAHLRQGFRNTRHLMHTAASGSMLSNRLALQLGALSAIGAYVVHSVFDFNLHIPANAALLAFVFGLVANPGTTHRSHSTQPLRLILFSRLATAFLGTILLIQCARLFPGEYYAERARIALRDEDPATAISFARKAAEHEQHNPETFFYLGRALIARANQSEHPTERTTSYQPAADAFKEAQRLAPLDGTYPLSLAFTYDEMGRFADAEIMYAVARMRDPSSTAVAQLYQAHRESLERVSASGNSSLQ